MRRLYRALLTLSATAAVVMALSGCGKSATKAPAATATALPAQAGQQPQGMGAAGNLPEGDQGQARGSGLTQLALGTFYLEGSEQAVTAEQAAVLLPLWQEVQAQSASESPAQDALAAAADRIRAAMSAEQLAAIDGLDLRSEEVDELMAELGVQWPAAMPEGGAGSQLQGTPGAQDVMPQGTPPAGAQMPEGTPGGGPRGGGFGGGIMPDSALLEKVISLLQERAAGD